MSIQMRQIVVNTAATLVTAVVSLLAAGAAFTVAICWPTALNLLGNTLFSTDTPPPIRSVSAVMCGVVFAAAALVAVARPVRRRVYRNLVQRYLAAAIAQREEIRNNYSQLTIQEKIAVHQAMSPESRRGLMRELDPEARREFAGLHESLPS